ncbi:MAG: sugar kinase [Planctomycetota bacterium]|nr:MAG: sugar kinase [Planctomycetota bacterium]
MSLVVVGSAGIDTVETPSGRVHDVVGGSAVYFALAASLFGPVKVAANIGADYPEAVWEVLRRRGADLGGVRRYADHASFRWSGRYRGDMNAAETLRTDLNVLALPPEPPASYGGARFVFLANMGPEVQLRCLERLGGEVVFADTMNLWIESARPALLALLRRVQGLVLNDAEARQLTGEDNLIRAGAALLLLGPQVVVLKKGEHGAFLFARGFHFALPAYPTTRVVDPTGAGDSFAGGLLGSLAAAGSLDPPGLRRAMAYGIVTASFTVEEFSTRGLERLERAQVDQRLEELREFVRL